MVHAEIKVHLTVQRLGVRQVSLEFIVKVFAEANILKHTLKLGRVFETASLL